MIKGRDFMALDASIIPFPVSAHLVRFRHVVWFQVFDILTATYQMSTIYMVAERVSYLSVAVYYGFNWFANPYFDRRPIS
jgi:hypothetical protein